MDTPEGKKSVTALAVVLAVAVTLLTPNASAAGASTSEAPTIGLKLVRRIVLAKPKGRIDQVVPLPKGGFVLRDSDFDQERFQAVEVYAATGRRLRQLGRFGQGPGSYYRLRAIGLSGGTILVADVVGRVTLFSEQGAFLGTKLVQNPGYQIDSIAVDEERGFFYLGGCLPTGIYVDRGCRLVHQYRLKDKRYRRSFLKSDPETISNGTTRWSDINIDTDPQGRVVAVDAPSFKLLRIDPLSGSEEVFPIRSQKVKPLDTLVEPNDAKRHYNRSALVERVIVVAPWVVVAVRRPKDAGFLLQIFDDQGRQVGIDLDPPGKLVGKSSAGGLLFASSTGTGWEIAEFSLVSTPPVP